MQQKRVTFGGLTLPLVLLAPQLAVTFVFFIWPASQAIYGSVLREDAFGLSRTFVGLANFERLFADPLYLNSLYVTIVFSLATAVMAMGLALLFAVAADKAIKAATAYKTLIIWPYAVAPAIAGVLWWLMFNPSIGIVAYVLRYFGYRWNHMLNGDHAMILVVIAAAWRQISYNFIFFLAGLQFIPRSLIESAAIDGAGPIKRFFTITLPLLSPTTFFLLVLNIVYAFFDTFGTIHATTSGGPGQATTILVYKVYRDGFIGLNLGSSSAQSVILMLVVIALTVVQFRYIERRVHYAWLRPPRRPLTRGDDAMAVARDERYAPASVPRGMAWLRRRARPAVYSTGMVENRPILVFLTHAVLIVGIAFIVLPVWLAFVASTRQASDFVAGVMPLVPGPYLWENYSRVLSRGVSAGGAPPIALMLFNSTVMALGIAVGKIAISLISAFAIVYFRFPFRMLAFWIIFITLMLPVEVRILPTFQVVVGLGLLNSYVGLTLPLIASATATFLFRQVFLTIPDELTEAARIDGAGPMKFFKDILVPLSRTNIAALFVIMFIYGWNQYLWPLLITTSDRYYTVVMGIQRMVTVADSQPQWHFVMATAILALLPPVIVIVVMQRLFVRGLVETEK